jgi:hypothetical protein
MGNTTPSEREWESLREFESRDDTASWTSGWGSRTNTVSWQECWNAHSTASEESEEPPDEARPKDARWADVKTKPDQIDTDRDPAPRCKRFRPPARWLVMDLVKLQDEDKFGTAEGSAPASLRKKRRGCCPSFSSASMAAMDMWARTADSYMRAVSSVACQITPLGPSVPCLGLLAAMHVDDFNVERTLGHSGGRLHRPPSLLVMMVVARSLLPLPPRAPSFIRPTARPCRCQIASDLDAVQVALSPIAMSSAYSKPSFPAASKRRCDACDFWELLHVVSSTHRVAAQTARPSMPKHIHTAKTSSLSHFAAARRRRSAASPATPDRPQGTSSRRATPGSRRSPWSPAPPPRLAATSLPAKRDCKQTRSPTRIANRCPGLRMFPKLAAKPAQHIQESEPAHV